MKSQEMINRLEAIETETLEQAYKDIPVYVYEVAAREVLSCLKEGIKHKLEVNDIYASMFISGYLTAKLAQKIELDDLFINDN